MSAETFPELCKTLAAATLCVGGAAFHMHEIPFAALEGILGLTSLAAVVGRRRAESCEHILHRVTRDAERGFEEYIKREYRDAPDARDQLDAAVAAFGRVVPRLVPKPEELVAARLQQDSVVAFLLEKAGRTESLFDTKTGDDIALKLFRTIVGQTYALLRDNPEYGAKLQSYVFEKLLTGQDEIKQQLAELKAMFRQQIAGTTAEYRLPREVVDRLLATAGFAGVEPASVPDIFNELARRYAAMREALERQSNDDPEIATLKQQAGAALASADLDAVDRLLAAIRTRQRALSERRRRAATDAQADFMAALQDEAATCVQQADAALLRLDVAEANGHYEDGIAVLADAPADSRLRYTLAAADALQDFGDRAGRNDALLACLGLYELALGDVPRERVPLDWAMTQNNLGAALWTLGERESGTARLEQALDAYRAALEEWSRERVPLEWAATQNNLGNALQKLGERESGTARLEQAVDAYREALEEFTRERVPLKWAMSQNNLGVALATLGERESGTARLEQAVAAYRAALEERTRERAPLDWAMTQNNLGNALKTLGARASGIAQLQQAVAAYRAALEERTRERVPLQWATTQNNLGNALRALGERESGTARLEQAVTAYREALEEFTRERVPLRWAGTQNNLGAAFARLGAREIGAARLEHAVAAYRAALEEFTRERVPLDWGTSQYNLANALAALAARLDDPARMAEALACMHNAVEAFRQGADTYKLPIAERRAAEIEAELAKMQRS